MARSDIAKPAQFETDVANSAISLSRLALRRFLRHRMALVGLVLLVVIILYVVAGTFFFSEANANRLDLKVKLSPPSQDHPLGTCLLYTSPSPRDRS